MSLLKITNHYADLKKCGIDPLELRFTVYHKLRHIFYVNRDMESRAQDIRCLIMAVMEYPPATKTLNHLLKEFNVQVHFQDAP